MLESSPLISIVIPVKNGGPWLDSCLNAITRQSLFDQTEVVIIDSGSSDNSVEIAKKYPVRLYTVSADEYDHGLTRNLGVKYSRGKYVVMTVQDATAVDDLWLQKLLDGFSAAENVAGVCGQQIVPHDSDKNPVDWFRPMSEPVVDVFKFSANEFDLLSPAEKKAACGWDDVTAMYRREILEEFPFIKTSYGEDAVWAKEVLKAGYSIVYNTAARVYHYHHENRDFVFKRTLTVMYFRYKHFGFMPDPAKRSFRSYLSTIKLLLKTKGFSLKEKWNWFNYNLDRDKATLDATNVFISALNQSEKDLDEVHQKYCGKAPVPLKSRLTSFS